MFTSKQLRQKYLDFFKSKGHTIIPSASLIPENDPTVLFTTAGMHPLVPYLLGEKHSGGARLANVQKCVRTGDIDEVGDKHHDTFFEMLGNWSFGDSSSPDGIGEKGYFKKEAIAWSWEFLTSPEWLGLNPNKLIVSVFEGDIDALRDEESAAIWRSLGVAKENIIYLPKSDNWWGPAGQSGPCGPDTEMFYWKGDGENPLPGSNPKIDENNWLEIWNDVFMEYYKKVDGTFKPLAQKNVDTGMGLERALVALNGFVDVFQIDTFWPLIQKIQELSGHEYIEDIEITKAMRVVADHIRAAVMILGDDRGIAPSNLDQGYIVRRLLRRAIRYGRQLGINENFCGHVAKEVIKIFSDVYPETARNRDFILNEITKEENKFRNTLEKGLKILRTKMRTVGMDKLDQLPRQNFLEGYAPATLTGKFFFDIYQTYGFPFEDSLEEIEKNSGSLLISEKEKLKNQFNEEMKKHQEMSRAGAEQKFKGGLADNSEISTEYHTATHLLHAALRQVLGVHVEQRGSNITAERLRFDFSHPSKMTDEQKQMVENLVNAAIQKDYQVSFKEMTLLEAKEAGAIGLFEERYGEKVKVYTIGDSAGKSAAIPASATFSKEICGGPHVDNTGALGHFKIIKEEAVSSGVRRIKAILE